MGQKAVTRNRTGNSAQHSQAGATPVKASNRRQRQPANSGRAGSKRTRRRGRSNNRSGADVLVSYAGVHPCILPAKSAALNLATNGYRERSNPLPSLHEGAAGRANDGRGRDWPRSQGPQESRGICRRGHAGVSRRAASGARHHEHTGDGSAGMAGHPLAEGRAACPQAPTADLPSFPAGGRKDRSPLATPADEFLVG